MLRELHHDEAGRFNIVHAILIILFVAGSYLLAMYYPPYYQYYRIKTTAEQMALSATTSQRDDDRNKQWFDAEMEDIGAEFPKSYDLVYYRFNEEQVEVAFQYDYDVNHPFIEPHRLHFNYRCMAVGGRCREM